MDEQLDYLIAKLQKQGYFAQYDQHNGTVYRGVCFILKYTFGAGGSTRMYIMTTGDERDAWRKFLGWDND